MISVVLFSPIRWFKWQNTLFTDKIFLKSFSDALITFIWFFCCFVACASKITEKCLLSSVASWQALKKWFLSSVQHNLPIQTVKYSLFFTDKIFVISFYGAPMTFIWFLCYENFCIFSMRHRGSAKMCVVFCGITVSTEKMIF